MRLLLLFLLLPSLLSAQTYSNLKYGPHERNTFDIYLPQSATPTPLVIYIHGGGFVMGDKQDAAKWRQKDIDFFLSKGIAFASINYRYYKNDDRIGVGNCLDDVQHAIQYIRHQSRKFNLDKTRVVCYGHSAGAGSSMYLAFHDDFAIPGDTSYLGESTRILAVGALETQATYDLFRWLDIVPGLKMVARLQKKFIYNSLANFYGYPDFASFEPLSQSVPAKYDLLDMISPDDPPVYLMNLQKERIPLSMGLIQHHRTHALVLKETLDNHHIENVCYVYSRSLKKAADAPLSIRDFLLTKLTR